MKLQPNRKRLREIRKVYKSLGIDSETLQHHTFLVDLCRRTMPKQPVTLIEAGTNSNGRKGLEGASLRG